jgi:hypothetical protein
VNDAGKMRAAHVTHELRLRTWGALVLLIVYAAPVYFPPAGLVLEAPSAAASLSERLFPGVPAAWVWLRLAALLGAALLLAQPLGEAASSGDTGAELRARSPARRAISAALLLAVAHLAAGFWVPHFGRGAQLAYLVAVLVPALLLFVGTPRRATDLRPSPAVSAALGIIIVAWLLLRVLPAWHSPRAASATDMWLNFQWLMDAAASDRNLLASRSELSASDAWMLLAGVDMLGPAASLPAFPVVVSVGALWLVAGAGALAILCGTTVGWWPAVVATAAFLFSPLCLSLAVSPAPFGVPIAIGTGMAVLLWRFHTQRSAAAFAGFAALAGMGATQLHLLHVSLLGMALAIVLALRRPRIEPALAAIALCAFLAPTVPSLGDLPSVGQVRQQYVSRHWQWAGLEQVLHEQRGLLGRPTPDELMYGGVSAPLDVRIGTLLMPFAVPRTALRLIGDVLFEPLTAALAALGIAIACVRRREAFCTAAIGFLVAALLPSLAGSQYDRISMTRAILLPVSLAVFAAFAFDALAKAYLPGRRYAAGAAVLAALIVVSGVAIFDGVNPRILGVSAMELALETNAASARAVVVTRKGNMNADWLHVERIAEYLPAQRLPVVHFAAETDLTAAPAADAQAFLWSPGMEEDTQLSRTICTVMPSAALYEVRSRSGLARLYAAARDAKTWRPSIERSRWTASDCAGGLPAAARPR